MVFTIIGALCAILAVVSFIASINFAEGLLKDTSASHGPNPFPALAAAFGGPFVEVGLKVFSAMLVIISGLCFYIASL